MDASQPQPPVEGHGRLHDPEELKLRPRTAITWPKSHESSLPDVLPSKGKISKVWRSLRQKSSHVPMNNNGTRTSDGRVVPLGADEADWSRTQRGYPESVLSRVTGTTLVGDNDSVVSQAVSLSFPTSASASIHNESMESITNASVSGDDLNVGAPNEPALGLPRHWTFPGPGPGPGPSIPLRTRLNVEEDLDDSMSTRSNDTVMHCWDAKPHYSHRGSSMGETYRRQRDIILPSTLLHSEILRQHQFGDLRVRSDRGENGHTLETPDPHDSRASIEELFRQVVQFLASGSTSGFEASLHDEFGNTFLHILAAWAEPRTFMMYLEQAVITDATNSGGETFLHLLKEDWYVNDAEVLLRLIETLVAEGFRISAQNVYGQNIAHLICKKINDHATLLKIRGVFDSGMLTRRDAFGLKPQEFMDSGPSIGSDLDNIAHSFEASFASIGADAIWRLDAAAPTPQAFLAAVSDYDHSLNKFFRRTLKDPQGEDHYTRNGLHSVAASTYARLKYLSSGVPEILPSSRTRTWIHQAVNDRRGDLVKATLSKAKTYVSDLIEVGVDVNSYNSFGNTVLMDFVAFVPEDADDLHDNAILQFLIDAGARLEARNRRGETAFLVAARCGRRAAMNTLIRAGSRVKVTNLQGHNALTILEYCRTHPEAEIDHYADFESCSALLSSLSDDLTLMVNPIDEWGLPHIESVEFGSKPALGTKFTRDDAAIAAFSGKVFAKADSQLSADDTSQISEKMAFIRSSTHSTMDVDARTIRSTMTSSSSGSLSQEMNSLTDEMCGMILSNAFGSSMNEVSSPQEAWESVRRCLDELSILVSEESECDYSEGWDTHTQDMRDNDGEPRHISESRTGSFPASQSSRKRENSALRQGEDSDDGEDSDSHNDGGRRGRKWTDGATHDSKRSKGATRISCPYRKRNPVRYNIRKHFNCATQSFPNISLVKRHVITHHKRQTPRRGKVYICSRCQESFDTLTAHDAHLRVPPDQICPLRDATSNQDTVDDPEDGVTAEVVNKLRDRRSKVGVNTWDALWLTLFPGDHDAKSEDFEPIIEIDEVREAFEGNAQECASALQTVSSGMVLDTTRISPEGLGRILWGLYQSFIHNTLQLCRDVLISPAVAIPRRQVALAREMTELRGVVIGDLSFALPRSLGYQLSNAKEQSSIENSRTPRTTSAGMVPLGDQKSPESFDHRPASFTSENKDPNGQEDMKLGSIFDPFLDLPGGFGDDCGLCGRNFASCTCFQDLSTESGFKLATTDNLDFL